MVLTSNLSLKAVRANRHQVADRLVSRAASILNENRFSTWISQHGGWVSINMLTFGIIYAVMVFAKCLPDTPSFSGWGSHVDFLVTKGVGGN